MVSQKSVQSTIRRRRGSYIAQTAVALSCFAAILVAAYVFGQKGLTTEQPASNTAVVQQADQPVNPANFKSEIAVPEIPQSPATLETSTKVAKDEVTSVPTEAKPESLSEKVQERLASGEFGKAWDLAKTSRDAHEQSELFGRVAEAQSKLGEFEEAFAAIRQMPVPEDRSKMFRETNKDRAQAMGGVYADPSELIDLIQTQTSGLWDDEDGEGGTITFHTTGVLVDPYGQLHLISGKDWSNLLASLGNKARTADLNVDMSKQSSLRLVSLTRLEKEIAKRLAEGKPVLETMKNLAGLQKIQYVFVFPENNEIVIGGPAEGWKYTDTGMALGNNSGHPVLQLDDFVTVFRAMQNNNGTYRCAIVPRKESMRRMKEFADSSKNAKSNAGLKRFVQELENILGMQDVLVQGIPVDSRVSMVMVDADYRMKLIGIDKMHTAANIPSYFDLLSVAMQRTPQPTNALRWWMTMKYDSLLHSEDRNVFQLVGSSVRCRSENEIITKEGNRIHTGNSDPANKSFENAFTNRYEELAKHDKVFADLQNIFDLSLVAALIRFERIDERTSWNGGVFTDEEAYQTSRYDAVTEVPTVANHRVYRGRDVVIQVAGGVRVDAASILKNKEKFKMQPRLESVSQEARAPKLPEGRWWWDVKQEN